MYPNGKNQSPSRNSREKQKISLCTRAMKRTALPFPIIGNFIEKKRRQIDSSAKIVYNVAELKNKEK